MVLMNSITLDQKTCKGIMQKAISGHRFLPVILNKSKVVNRSQKGNALILEVNVCELFFCNWSTVHPN